MRGRERELITLCECPSRVDNPLMKCYGEMKIFLEQVPLFCEVSSERTEEGVCAKLITGLQCCVYPAG